MLTIASLDRYKLSGMGEKILRILSSINTKLNNPCYCLNSLKHKTLALPKELTPYLKLL